MELLADTNIFGIAVDPKDKRRKSVWKTFKKIASGQTKLHISQITIVEIQENPHEFTRQRETELVQNLVEQILPLTQKTREISEKLEKSTSLDLVDSQIVSTAIANNLKFWSGDRYILRQKDHKRNRKNTATTI